jgi:hypothetical protein
LLLNKHEVHYASPSGETLCILLLDF